MAEATDKALVVFTPSGRRGQFPLGTPVLQAARQLGVDVDSVCGGRGICGRCQVLVSEGEFAKHGITSRADHVSGITESEERYRQKNKEMPADRRLSCQAKLCNNVVIDVPASSQVHHQVVRKEAEARDIALDPLTDLYYIEVQEPDMHDPSGDLQRVMRALDSEWQLQNLEYDLNFVQTLQKILRKGEWGITVAIREEKTLIGAWPGLKEAIYGVAVDVGSTTIAAHLCDLKSGEVLKSAGIMNPQIRFGEDVMSRVSYVMLNPEGKDDMTKAVREALNQLVQEIAKDAGIEVTDIVEMTFVANPIMHHLLLGISPAELGVAPFALATDAAFNLRAVDMDLKVHPSARVYVLPCVAGHVGADTAGMVLAEAPYDRDEISLLVDVGTNAEIILGNKDRMFGASSPTGPAFEGAQINSGQRAAPGAIERAQINKDTLEPRYKVIGCNLWSDEPGFEEAIAKTGVTGICGSGIIEIVAEMYLAGIITQDGVIDGAMEEKNPRVRMEGRTYSYLVREGENPIRIMQNDIRAIQLAKAALYAGIKILMRYMGIQKVDRIRLAGAFGSHIDVKYAMVLGLIPDCNLANVTSAGNAAGTGARIALLNAQARKTIEKHVFQIEKIETAIEASFQQTFLDAMAFPNKVDEFPELEKSVLLPEPKIVADMETKRNRRRKPAEVVKAEKAKEAPVDNLEDWNGEW